MAKSKTQIAKEKADRIDKASRDEKSGCRIGGSYLVDLDMSKTKEFVSVLHRTKQHKPKKSKVVGAAKGEEK